MEALVAAAAGIVGAVIGAVVAWFANTRQSREAMAFSMHREFNSVEMVNSRHIAGKLLDGHPTESVAHLRNTLEPTEMRHVWNVLYFYQRLWLGMKYKAVDERYVPGLFGSLFYWWYEGSFQRQLVPLRTQLSRDIDELRKWIDDKTSEEVRNEWRHEVKVWKGEDVPKQSESEPSKIPGRSRGSAP